MIFLEMRPACFGLFFSLLSQFFFKNSQPNNQNSTKQPFVFQLLDVGLVNMKQEHRVWYSECEKIFDRCGAFI